LGDNGTQIDVCVVQDIEMHKYGLVIWYVSGK
jgi:hypothetical protein